MVTHIALLAWLCVLALLASLHTLAMLAWLHVLALLAWLCVLCNSQNCTNVTGPAKINHVSANYTELYYRQYL